MRVTVVGLGLIGGSVALAARERLGAQVTGVDPDPAALEGARRRGAVDETTDDLRAALAEAEVAFVAAPVGALIDLVPDVLAAAPADCVVTDVGSVKRALTPLAHDPRFVGGHPLAGAETAGIEHARAELFDGAVWYLCPATGTEGILYERLHRLLEGLGARPVAIEAEAHDAVMAAVSHLPHVLANLLVSEAAATLAAQGERLPVTGPSFRDATRVAGANTGIWADIYLANADALITGIDRTIERLSLVRADLAARDRDAIAAWNDTAAADRRALAGDPLAGAGLVELRIPVPNRRGIVAEVCLELSRAGIDLSDLSLHPAPDMASGVMALWVTEPTAARAEAIVAGLDLAVIRP